MNILFLTLMKISSVYDEGIYMDLMRCFSQNGHRIYIVSPLEKSIMNPLKYRKKTGSVF